ncbi:TlpA family protein disulfide reductase [Blastococcus tunisiensis]|uniref:Thiol-disulfide isomerase or thioredoxin n=1 Tax=Blastococcus tunisiensis TaxID=1798228 RepID=A0A1I1XLF8_9ACTN|nr:TlpA disulfide reductase family protein [Blastococcus sp. DSM 46838]SFE08051.1 Thiol-disulfide isomerase or thioredoxin [Blastococcus sp. DSM 46838]
MRLPLIALLLVVLSACTADPEAAPDEAPPTSVAEAETDLPPCPEQGPAASEVDAALGDLVFECFGGGDLDLASAPGTPTVLNLWASWCAPCREELPFVDQLATAAGDRLRVIGVASQDGIPQASSFAADAGLGFPSAFDADGALAAGLGLKGLPHSVFLAPDGSVAHVEVGAVDSYDELRALVSEHLGVQL